MVTLYGIPSCDTCRKARKVMEINGLEVSFRDIREDPLSAEDIARFLAAFGEKLLNTRSTTWRGLDEDARSGAPDALLAAHPTLMKRPVIESDQALTLGWDAATLNAHGGR